MRKINVFALSVFVAALAVSPFRATATPLFAKKEKKACAYCHLDPAGGGPRGFRGIYYKEHKLTFKKFVEKTEAKKAGVKPNAMGKASKPTKPYKGK